MANDLRILPIGIQVLECQMDALFEKDFANIAHPK
jgi:hypothetical protein